MVRIVRLVFLAAVGLAACAPEAHETDDATTDAIAATDELPRNVHVFPAVKGRGPIVANLGGPLLASPHFIPITFTGDPLASDIERFAAGLGDTDYWRTTTAEYGIGPADSLTPVRLTETVAAAIDDREVQSWLAAKLESGSSDFPPPDEGNLYAIYYPSSTTVTFSGMQSCTGYGAYHNEVALSDGRKVPYAVLPRCQRFMNYDLTPLELLTVASSHEIIEAVTDPFPQTDPAYLQTESFYGLPLAVAELADTCNANARINGTVDDSPITVPGFPYRVQRIWSNKASRAGHNPCVPSTGTYFNAAPVTVDTFDATPIQGARNLAGWKIAPGSKRTIEVDVFSDAATPDAIELTVNDLTEMDRGTARHTRMTLDKKSVRNGDRVKLTVEVLAGAAPYVAFALVSTLGAQKSYWYGTVLTGPVPADGAHGGGSSH